MLDLEAQHSTDGSPRLRRPGGRGGPPGGAGHLGAVRPPCPQNVETPEARTSVRASVRPSEIVRHNQQRFDYTGAHSLFGAFLPPGSALTPGTTSNSTRESPEGLLNPRSQTANRFPAGTALDESVAAALDFE